MRKRIAFFPAHPSQIWVLRPVAEISSRFADVSWFLRDKDISIRLADDLGMNYSLISRAGSGLVGNGFEFLRNMSRSAAINRRLGIDLWVTKYGACHLVSRFQGRSSLGFIDDDIELIPMIAWTSYPFVNEIIAPEVTRMGRWNKKTVRFPGNFELSYLHPDRFKPDPGVFGMLGMEPDTRFGVVRLSSLAAHHDVGRKGVSSDLLARVIEICNGESVRVFITSEKPVEQEFEAFRMPVPPACIHSVLAQADYVLGDSQTMIQEAAVLGTPAFRINDFVGRISIIEELENMELAFGFLPGNEDGLLVKLREILAMKDRREVFAARRTELLDKWVDPVPLMVERIRHLLGMESSLEHIE